MATTTTKTNPHGPVVMSDAARAVLFDDAVLTNAAEDGTEDGTRMRARELNGAATIPDCSGTLGGTRADVEIPDSDGAVNGSNAWVDSSGRGGGAFNGSNARVNANGGDGGGGAVNGSNACVDASTGGGGAAPDEGMVGPGGSGTQAGNGVPW